MLKPKIFAQLKVTYSGVADEVLNGIADYLQGQITEEAEIEKGVTNVSGLVDVMKKEYDRRVSALVSENTKLKADAETAKEKEAKKEPEEKKDTKKSDDTPAWAQALLESNQKLQDKVLAMESNQVVKVQQEKAISLLKSKEIPDTFFKKIVAGKIFKDDSELSDFVTEVETDWTAFQQEMSDKGLTSIPKPTMGKPNAQGVSNAVQDYIDSKKASDNGGDLGGKKLI